MPTHCLLVSLWCLFGPHCPYAPRVALLGLRLMPRVVAIATPAAVGGRCAGLPNSCPRRLPCTSPALLSWLAVPSAAPRWIAPNTCPPTALHHVRMADAIGEATRCCMKLCLRESTHRRSSGTVPPELLLFLGAPPGLPDIAMRNGARGIVGATFPTGAQPIVAGATSLPSGDDI